MLIAHRTWQFSSICGFDANLACGLRNSLQGGIVRLGISAYSAVWSDDRLSTSYTVPVWFHSLPLNQVLRQPNWKYFRRRVDRFRFAVFEVCANRFRLAFPQHWQAPCNAGPCLHQQTSLRLFICIQATTLSSSYSCIIMPARSFSRPQGCQIRSRVKLPASEFRLIQQFGRVNVFPLPTQSQYSLIIGP